MFTSQPIGFVSSPLSLPKKPSSLKTIPRTRFENPAPVGTLTLLYSFCSQPNCADGWPPYARRMGKQC